MRLMRHSISRRRATVLILIVGLLAMLFMLVSAYITLARFDRVRTRQITTRDERQRIIASTQGLLVSTIAKARDVATSASVTLSESQRLVTAQNYPLIAGSSVTPWLAAQEPVQSPTPVAYPLRLYSWPNVTSLNGKGSGAKTVEQLMQDDDGSIVKLSDPDAKRNARRPFMDAMGTGVNDAGFAESSLTTEMANAIAGSATRADFDIDDLSDPITAALYQQFERTARYQVPVRIVNNGGMILVGGDPNSWNSVFRTKMFNWIKHPNDPQLSLSSPVSQALQALPAIVAAVEPALRARGSMLVSEYNSATVPPALRTLQTAYPATFLPEYQQRFSRAASLGDWQRFNISSSTEWKTYGNAASFDASRYDTAAGTGATPDPRTASNRRRYLTSISHSDELAWNLDPNNDNDPNAVQAGSLKFYLGRINAIPSDQNDPNGAFLNSRFRSGPNGAGTKLVSELRRYFREMLSQHDFDPNQAVNSDAQAAMLAVNAVAFAAPQYQPSASSPWRNDVVAYRYPEDTSVNGAWYFGYAPQPYITQVMAYYDPNIAGPADANMPVDPNDLADPNNLSKALVLAVELYNPHESDYPSSNASLRHYVDLSQFALSVGDSPTPVLTPLVAGSLSDQVNAVAGADSLPVAMRGRSFVTLEVSSAATSASRRYFTRQIQGGFLQSYQLNGTIPTSQMQGLTGDTVTVRLWRLVDDPNTAPELPLSANNLRAYVVDKAVMDVHDRDSDPNFGWWASLERDMNADEWVGGPIAAPGAQTPKSCWRMAVAFNDDDPATDPNEPALEKGRLFQAEWGATGHEQPKPTTYLYTLGSYASDAKNNGLTDPTAPYAPSVPLHTLNADLGDFSVHGALRPRAYPTVGFMLFLSRYAHTYNYDNTGQYRPVTQWLFKQWHDVYAKNNSNVRPNNIPLDFGHMPVFDNTQKEKSGGAMDTFDTVPWGQLVYDFFTTLNPASVDPYAVNGRINVNAASWFAIAGLPVIGPTNGNVTADIGDLKGTGGNPAFYAAVNGVLAGESPQTYISLNFPMVSQRQRYPLPAKGWDGSQGWWRVGAWRAQAAAAYRDGVQYTKQRGDVSLPPDVLRYAFERNAHASSTERRYRPNSADSYGKVRGVKGADFDPNYPGFVTLGELLNAPGWDGVRDDELDIFANSMVPTVLVRAAGPQGAGTWKGEPDYMRAVSLMALLDTQFLTTRSNTFTVYASLFDRTNPEASVRTQLTVDRSNMLPRRILVDTTGGGGPYVWQLVPGPSQPEIVSQRTTNYYNARYDD